MSQHQKHAQKDSPGSQLTQSKLGGASPSVTGAPNTPKQRWVNLLRPVEFRGVSRGKKSQCGPLLTVPLEETQQSHTHTLSPNFPCSHSSSSSGTGLSVFPLLIPGHQSTTLSSRADPTPRHWSLCPGASVPEPLSRSRGTKVLKLWRTLPARSVQLLQNKLCLMCVSLSRRQHSSPRSSPCPLGVVFLLRPAPWPPTLTEEGRAGGAVTPPHHEPVHAGVTVAHDVASVTATRLRHIRV
uniref:Uncharacterized protein n=1 Tax=Knipowitschia caucasica TaxID=637954 RepID=A0AAV2MAM2_KNICA